jgi:hypothetical protein
MACLVPALEELDLNSLVVVGAGEEWEDRLVD